MQIVVCPDAGAATDRVVEILTDQIHLQPRSTLGLATGGTMEGVYKGLRAAYENGLSFAQVRTFNLDEYTGLAPDHPQSYAYYMAHHLFVHIDIKHTHLPNGLGDPRDAARAYESILDQYGPIDLQLLGLGRNGHIGFNEPGSAPTSRTHKQVLTADTIAANARFFGPEETQPTSGVTMGIRTIQDARKIVLLATGTGKSAAVAAMLNGPVTRQCPASILQKHPDTTIILDADAAREIT